MPPLAFLSILPAPALPLAEAGAAAPADASPLPMFVMVGLMVGIFYFLVFRPQRRMEHERQAMQNRVKKNDRVLLSCGIKGVVTNVKEDEVTVRVDDANNVRINFTKSSIAAVVSGDDREKSSSSSESSESKKS